MNWKNLISNSFLKSNNSLISISKFLSLISMSIGCFSIIIALSVMNGFENIVKNKLRGFDGDFRITGNFNPKDFDNIKEIKNISAFIERRGVIEKLENTAIVTFKALESKKINDFYDIPFDGLTPKEGQVMLGKDLAISLGVDIGDSILVFSPIDQTVGFGIQKKKKMYISGIFYSRVLDYDNRYVFMSIIDAERIFNRKQKKINCDIRVDSNIKLKKFKNKIKLILNDEVLIYSWSDLNRSLVNAMKLEKLGAFIILSLIFVVSSFNLAMTLSLNSIQNLKEIGLLKVIGASRKSILNIILIMGFKLAGLGIFFGLFSAIIVVFLQNYYGFISIPSEIYFIDSLPMKVEVSNVIAVLLISSIFVFVTSYFSAKSVSKIPIMDSFQWIK